MHHSLLLLVLVYFGFSNRHTGGMKSVRPRAVLVILTLQLIALAQVVAACAHSSSGSPIEMQQGTSRDQHLRSQQEGRFFNQQSATTSSFNPLLWRPIQIFVNTTFVTNSDRDVFSIGGIQACQFIGQVITAGQVAPASAPLCQTSRTVENCRYVCTAEDIVTPSAIAGITAAVRDAALWAQSFLLVNSSITPLVTLFDPAASSTYTAGNVNCGFMSLGTPNGTSVAGSDIVVYVTARPLAFLAPFATQYPPDAVSDVCVVSSDTGRPLQSRINIQPAAIARAAAAGGGGGNTTSTVTSALSNVTILARHMLLHALGLSTTAAPYYRNPLTMKKYTDEALVRGEGVVLTNATTTAASQSTSTVVVISDPSIVFQNFNTRNATTNSSSSSSNNNSSPASGQQDNATAIVVSQLLKIDSSHFSSTCRPALRTPNVLSAASAYYSCPTVNVVELENVGGMDEHLDMHWESRLMYGDIMSSVPLSRLNGDAEGINSDDSLSYLTLAWLVDTGYYSVDPNVWSMVKNRSLNSVGWGRGRGCGWVKDNCSAATWGSDYQCTAPRAAGAGGGGGGSESASGSGRVAASVGYNNRFYGACPETAFASPLPPGYQHFADPDVGGTDFLADFCSFTPLNTPAAVRSCNATSPLLMYAMPSGDTYTSFGEMNGPSTRAVLSTLVLAASFSPPSFAFGECLQFFCVSVTSLYVRAGSILVPCPSLQRLFFDFPFRTNDPFTANVTSFDYVGSVTCPNVTSLCSNTYRMANADLWIGRSGNSSSSKVMLAPLSWPSIVRVTPPNVSNTGGDTITVIGNWLPTGNLKFNCSGIRLGGLLMMGVASGPNMVLVNTTDFTTADSKYGGNNSDGTGVAALELVCQINSTASGDGNSGIVCDLPDGACSVASWPAGVVIQYSGGGSDSSSGGTAGPTTTDTATDAFFRSAAGQAVLALVGVTIFLSAGMMLKILSPASPPPRSEDHRPATSVEEDDPFQLELLPVASPAGGKDQNTKGGGGRGAILVDDDEDDDPFL